MFSYDFFTNLQEAQMREIEVTPCKHLGIVQPGGVKAHLLVLVKWWTLASNFERQCIVFLWWTFYSPQLRKRIGVSTYSYYCYFSGVLASYCDYEKGVSTHFFSK